MPAGECGEWPLGRLAGGPPFGPVRNGSPMCTLARLALTLALSLAAAHLCAQVAFRLVDASGEPITGATARLLPAAPADSSAVVYAVSDEEGRVRLSPKRRGRHRLGVTYVGYEPLRRDLETLDPSAELDLGTLRLRPDVAVLAEAQVMAVRARPADPFAFADLDGVELAEANVGLDVPTLLRRTPGAVVTSDAGTGIGYSSIRIRGADATRVNVTVNGVPLNDAESQGVFWVNMPDFISSTRSLQVQRGVGQSTYGTGAFGANVNLLTDVPPARPRLVAELAGGSYGTRRAMVKAATGELGGAFSGEGRLSYVTSDGFVDRASARLGAAYLGAAYEPSPRERLQLIGWTGHERTYQAWYGIPRAFAADPERRTYNPAGARGDGEFYDDQVDDYRQSHAQALYSRQLPGGALLQLTGHYTRGLGFYEEWQDSVTTNDYLPNFLGERLLNNDVVRRLWLDNHFYGAIATLSGRLSPKLELTASAGVNEYRGDHYGTVPRIVDLPESIEPFYDADDRYYDNEGRKRSGNAFAKGTYAVNQRVSAYADVQLRAIEYAFAGVDRDGAVLPQEVSYAFFNPKAGFTISELAGGSAYASVAVGQREPNRNDFREAPPGEQPRPERLTDFEVGWRRRAGGLELEAGAYYMRYRDQLAPTGRLNDVGELVRANVDASYRLGLELAAAYRLAPAWIAEGNLALSRNRIRRFDEFVDDWDRGGQFVVVREDVPLAFSPGAVANLGIRFAKADCPLEVALWGAGVSRQHVDNSGSAAAALPAYGRVDLEARYAPRLTSGRGVVVTLQVQNLTDAHPVTNGWSYRFRSAGYDPRPDDPYAARESGDTYLLTGVYPQAGTQVLLGVRLEIGG